MQGKGPESGLWPKILHSLQEAINHTQNSCIFACIHNIALFSIMSHSCFGQWKPNHLSLLMSWNSSGRCPFVSLLLFVILGSFFLGLDLDFTPSIWAAARRFAVFVTGLMPFFWSSFSTSTMSRGNSVSRKRSFRSSSTFIFVLGSLGYTMSSCESMFDNSQTSPAAFSAYSMALKITHMHLNINCRISLVTYSSIMLMNAATRENTHRMANYIMAH